MPKTSLAVELGKLIRELRIAKGYSQEGFAYRCGVHRTYQTHVERGTKNPSVLILAKIARGLEIEVSAIWLELEKRGVTAQAVTDEPIIR